MGPVSTIRWVWRGLGGWVGGRWGALGQSNLWGDLKASESLQYVEFW